jgi:putative hydrolase of the HAD superfamily
MPKTGHIIHRKIRAVIFDMDNTLFDFVAAKRHACGEVAKFLRRRDGERLFEYFLHGSHGFESHENIRDYLTDCNRFDEEAFSRCVAIYQREKLSVLVPYPGIHEVLEEMREKSMRMAILTDAHRDNALLRLEKLDLLQYFDYIVTTDMTGTKKPAPEPFLFALQMLGTAPKETLLIGDSLRRDIAPGKTLGMLTAYAQYGDRNIPVLVSCTPDIVFHSIQEMADFLPMFANE